MRRVISAFFAVMIGATALHAEIEIKEAVSAGGITAWVVEEPSLPFIALELRFRGGTSLDNEGKRGAVNLMTALLEEGAGPYDAQQFARELEGLAASITYDADPDMVGISARFLTETRDEALELLRVSISEPQFSNEAIDRVRPQVLSIIGSDAKDPDSIARNTFNRIAFGAHNYGSDPNGTLETVAALTRDDLLAAHRNVFAKDRLYVGIVGDITVDEAGPILDRLLGDLPEKGTEQPSRADILMTGGVTVVPFDTPQSVALFGQPGIAQDHPDFFAARLLNQVLGAGGFESRLMTEIREKRGLTYGVYSFLYPRDHAATLEGQLASSNERISEAIALVREEWQRMAQSGVTVEELNAAKTFVTGSYPLRFEGNSQIASIVAGMQMLDLPIDYIATRNQKVKAVTLADVNRVAAELLDPERLHFVIVGQPTGVSQD